MKYINTCFISIFVLFNIAAIGCQRKSIQKQDQITHDDTSKSFKVDSIYTKILGEERPIWIHVPESVDKSKKYPVIYLLDGNFHFDGVLTLMNYLHRFDQIPEMVIVGIPNTNRMLDLTPSYMKVSRDGDPIPKGVNGGGEMFTSFLEKELIPYVEETYPVTKHRTFIGHSLGGLLVVNTLIHHSEIFDNYIAIDPSLWWNNQNLLKESKEVMAKEKFKNKSLYIAVANTLRDGMTIANVKKDTSDASMHIRSILDFAKVADSNTQNEMFFDWKYYEKENHGSIPLIAEYEGLKSVFSWYHMNINDEFRKPIATPEYLVDFIEKHYDKMSYHFGYEVKPDEEFINRLGYRFLSTNPEFKAKSFAFFNLNIKNYPKSAKVYDAMADYYEKQNDIESALKNVMKAYEIEPNTEYKARVERFKEMIK